MGKNIFIVLIFTLLSFNLIEAKRYVPTPNKSSRNFIDWMKTVPEDASFGYGMKRLVTNINPSMTQ